MGEGEEQELGTQSNLFGRKTAKRDIYYKPSNKGKKYGIYLLVTFEDFCDTRFLCP